MKNLKQFRYKYDKGPISLEMLKRENFEEGNCRLAVQYYFYKNFNKYLEPDLVLNPKAYKEVGKFIINENSFDNNSISLLKKGDIIYADRLSEKKKSATNKVDWIIQLHTAIYLGNNQIWHSTIVENKSCYWSFEKFLSFYKPIAAKRIIEKNKS